MVLTDNQLQALRRKLEALGYTDAVDPSSGPLVQKLTDDLVHTTDSYRTLKLQCARQAQEVNALNEKVPRLLQGPVPRPSLLRGQEEQTMPAHPHPRALHSVRCRWKP